MRVAAVDLGTNSTRLLVADVEDGRVVAECARESRVTRLGQGVDATGELSQEAIARVFAVLGDYRAAIDSLGAERTVAVLTSAVRDAANGAAFTEQVEQRFRLGARTISGAEEAELTFLGATSERAVGAYSGELVVIDVGGGSTELVVGRGGEVSWFSSAQIGVVRMTDRHVHSDPPAPHELQAMTEDIRRVLAAEIPDEVRARVVTGVAVAGTATSSAAIELELEPYEPSRAHGHRLDLGTLEMLLARLAAMDEEERRQVAGLHPDRAPTIVAGVLLLAECLRAFGLDRVEVSEHDVLRGAALRLAAADHR